MAVDFEIWSAYGEAFAKTAKKGTAVLIEGKLRPNNYEKEDGTKVFGYRVRVDRWQIVAQPGQRPGAKEQIRSSRKRATVNG